MRFQSRAKRLLLVWTCAAAACTPGGGGEAREGTTPGGTGAFGGGDGGIVFGVLGNPATLDPYSPLATDLTYTLVRPLFPSLFRFGPEGRAVAMLARSTAETGSGVRITLRRARWSNGNAITARDVVATVRRAESPSGLAAVSSARALGSRRVELRGASKNWRRTLATAAPILPGGGGVRPGGVSGGPFRLSSFTPGLEAVYRPNPRWWGPEPDSDRITVQFVADLEIMLALLRSGRLDGAAPPSSVNLGQRLDAMGIE
ncbi:MAG: hypothetical protein H0T12_05065, partial [Actinobacteria bacterium]|nr:hypothetical protein [Actinomycetota bacterium]